MTAKENSTLPAHPCPVTLGKNGEIVNCEYHGLTKREQFAMAAMQGIVQTGTAGGHTIKDFERLLGLKDGEYKADVHYPVLIARDAVIQADALLAELAKEQK